MSYGVSIRSLAACVFTAVVFLGLAYVNAGGTEPVQPAASTRPPGASTAITQPDTASPNWKAISDDLGIWVVKSDRGGMRGRLYVRVGNGWSPVAVDGAADVLGLIPAGK